MKALPNLPPTCEQGLGKRNRLTVPQQIRVSLQVSRAWSVPFDHAWKAALREVSLPKSYEHRHQWRALLSEPEFVDWWRAAYEHRGPDLSILRHDL
jgi:hypothetical protein